MDIWGVLLVVLDLSEGTLLGHVLLFLANFESEVMVQVKSHLCYLCAFPGPLTEKALSSHQF